MAAHDPAVDWWENDPRSPGRLSECDIALVRLCPEYPELLLSSPLSALVGLVVRPMFQVLDQ